MPTYQITDNQTGKKYKITGDRPPTQQEAAKLVASLKSKNEMQSSAPKEQAPVFPEIPNINGIQPSQAPVKRDEDRSVGEMIQGAGEAALTTLTGATGGAAGMLGGTVEGIGKAIAEGKFGTQEGAREAQETAMRRAGQLTYMPRTGAGQDFVETIGKATEALPIIPIIAPEAAAIRSGLQAARVSGPAMANKVRSKIKNVIARERPEVQVFTPEGNLTPQAMQVINANDLDSKIKGLMSPEEAQRYELFKSRGIEPTRSDITRSVDDQRNLREALKEQGPVVEAYAEQERGIRRVIENQADRLDDNLGAEQLTRDAVGSRIFDSIQGFVNKSDEAISAAYDAARQQGRADGRVVIAGDMAQTVLSNKKSDLNYGGLVSRVENILEDQGIIAVNDAGKMVITNKRLTVDEAEDIRKLLNRAYGSTKPGQEGNNQREFITTLKNAIDSDVERAVGDDIFADARKQKAIFERTVERDRRNKRDTANRELLRNIINNKIPEDKIVENLLSADKESFKQVKNFLLSENGGAEGARAFNNLKAYMLRDLLGKSLNKGTQVGGEPTFNPMRLGELVANLEQRGFYSELFSAKEQQLISDVIQIGKLRKVDQAVASGKGPSSYAISSLLRHPIVGRFPVIGEYISDVTNSMVNRRRDAQLLDPASGLESAVQRAASRQQGQVNNAPSPGL